MAEKNEHAVALGGLGGDARAKALCKRRRIEIARKAGLSQRKKGIDLASGKSTRKRRRLSKVGEKT